MESQDHLLRMVFEECEKLKHKEYKMADICDILGVSDTVNLFDERTLHLISLFNYYSSSATPCVDDSSDVWFDTVTTCELFKKVM